MTSLIEISKTQIGGAEINSVNARNLHEKLQSKQDFSTWIKKRLDDTQAVENYDFTSFHKKMEREIGATSRIEYIISLDLAKEFCMLEKNEIGKMIRKYFIEVEKEHKKPLSSLEILQATIKNLVEQEKAVKALENKTDDLAKEQLKTKHNINRLLNNDNYMTVIAYANLKGIKANSYNSAVIGKKATKLSKEQGAFMGAVIDPRYGRVNTYNIDILNQLF